MKLIVNNNTGLLNDYHFQSLCLLYFPSERFSDGEISPIKASFTLSSGEKGLCARVELDTPHGAGSAEFDESMMSFTVPTDDEGRAAAVSGKAFLECGRRLFGFTPPWGYLTGLRPVKRAKYYLERGYSNLQVIDLFVNDYSVCREKAMLSVETARRELVMLRSITPDMCGLYVSVPFCPTRCDYCSFVSYANKKLFDLIPAYVQRVSEDIVKTGRLIKELGFKPIALYIGGGTPSFLSEEQLRIIMGAINDSIDLSYLREYSFEGGRPDTLTAEKLSLIHSYGVDRISVNPQTTNDRALRAIGRKHTTEQFYAAAELAMKQGFRSVNADLIAGLPEDSFDDFAKSIEDVTSLGFNNVTVHSLSIKNAAELKNDSGSFDPVGALARKCVEYAHDELERKGLFPYYLYRQKRTVGNGENTGYAVSGKENLYNVMMMEEFSTVFACGAGAITKLVSPSKDKIERIAFQKYPFEYLSDDHGIGEARAKEFFAK